MHHGSISRPKPLMVAEILVLLGERSRHGYELAESLRTSDFEGITTSTVYRELAKLEADGLVQSFWQSSQARGPARHMYELTEAGRAELVACVDDVHALAGYLAGFLSRCRVLTPEPHGPDGAEALPAPRSSAPTGISRLWRQRLPTPGPEPKEL